MTNQKKYAAHAFDTVVHLRLLDGLAVLLGLLSPLGERYTQLLKGHLSQSKNAHLLSLQKISIIILISIG